MKLGVEIDPSSLAPVEQELELQQLALSWREALLQLQSIDEKQWSALQKVEEDVSALRPFLSRPKHRKSQR